jgi:hypothetical protein
MLSRTVSAFFVTRDHRATSRAIFIKTVYRHPVTALRTRALVDPQLDHRIGREHAADNYYRKNQPHSFQPPPLMNF